MLVLGARGSGARARAQARCSCSVPSTKCSSTAHHWLWQKGFKNNKQYIVIVIFHFYKNMGLFILMLVKSIVWRVVISEIFSYILYLYQGWPDFLTLRAAQQNLHMAESHKTQTTLHMHWVAPKRQFKLVVEN